MFRKVALLCVVAACGGGSGAGDDVGTDPDAGSGSGGSWTKLITKSWSLEPHSENTSDLGIDQVDHDFYIAGIRPIAPPGTHHTLLFRGLQSANAIYASGVGTGELLFPEGKGMLIPAGTSLGLQLHIYNTGDDPMTGTSGIEVLEVDASKVTEEVDMFLPGPKNFDIPVGVSTLSGTCTINTTQNVFALFPHMHQWGTHIKTTLSVAGVEQTLHDDDYTFEHQTVETFAPITLNPGDTITTDCTYNNDTANTLQYGESSDTEMCYSVMYRWPKQTGEFCTN